MTGHDLTCGDRVVVVTDDGSLPVGSVGTVVDIFPVDECVYVKFDVKVTRFGDFYSVLVCNLARLPA